VAIQTSRNRGADASPGNLPIPVGCGRSLFYIWDRATQNAVDSSVVAAKATIGQYKTLRQYYTENVIAKAVGEGGMKAGYDHKGVSKTLPLPATMIHDLSGPDGGGWRRCTPKALQ